MISRCVYEEPIFSYRVHPEVAHALLIYLEPTPFTINICRSTYQLHKVRGVHTTYVDAAVHQTQIDRWDRLLYNDERCVVELYNRPDNRQRLVIRCESQWAKERGRLQFATTTHQLRLHIWPEDLNWSTEDVAIPHPTWPMTDQSRTVTMITALRMVADVLYPFIGPNTSRDIFHDIAYRYTSRYSAFEWNRLPVSERFDIAKKILEEEAQQRGWEKFEMLVSHPKRPTEFHRYTRWMTPSGQTASDFVSHRV